MGTMDNCILGGSIEDQDLATNNHVNAAVIREAKEEIGIDVKNTSLLGNFSHEDRLIHVVTVDSWSGEVPAINFDNGNDLAWVPKQELINGIRLPELKGVLTKVWGT